MADITITIDARAVSELLARASQIQRFVDARIRAAMAGV